MLARPTLVVTLAATLAVALAAAPTTSGAQAADTTTITTAMGVYTAAQAATGKDVHAVACLSCHKPIEHTGPNFWNPVVGRPLAELFGYLRSSMPQDNPGSLSDSDYANVIAYIFSLNAVPAGEKPLPGDSTVLARIRVVPPVKTDTIRKGSRQ